MLVRPVILSGGSGTRLWPISRQRQPKQFVPLVGDECLFATTIRRVTGKPGFAPPIIVGSVEHKFLILDVLHQLEVKNATLLLEPESRNTAAAAMLAAIADVETGTDSLHLVMPSDHIISDEAVFLDTLSRAVPEAANGAFVLFGIMPTRAETGYGYIVPTGLRIGSDIVSIATFKEKPDERTARMLIEQGALWNSGIFLYSSRTLLNEAARLAPALLSQCQDAMRKSKQDLGCIIADAAVYKTIADEPFDRVIMEKTARGKVVACSMGWNDVGSWQALWEMGAKDNNDNQTIGPVVLRNSERSYVRSDGPAIAAMGIKDMTIVATKDAILVAPNSEAQQIREVVSELRKTDPAIAVEHPRVLRPWGSYEGIAHGMNFQVKHVIVKPGCSLSLQMHHHRAEHWVVVAGTAKVEYDGNEKLVFPNESAYIQRGSKHRVSNPGRTDLHMIEVQCGDYLGEDDIVRFADVYGRDKP